MQTRSRSSMLLLEGRNGTLPQSRCFATAKPGPERWITLLFPLMLTLSCAIASSGCLQLTFEALESRLPDYQTVRSRVPPVARDDARLAIYFPKEVARRVGETLAAGSASLRFILRLDDGRPFFLDDNSFQLTDVRPGMHSLSDRKREHRITFEAAAGQTTFVRCDMVQLNTPAFRVVDLELGGQEIRDLHQPPIQLDPTYLVPGAIVMER